MIFAELQAGHASVAAALHEQESMMFRLLGIAFLISVFAGLNPAMAQAPAAPQPPATAPGRGRGPQAPTRDPHSPGYVEAKELPDGEVPSPTADGNFIIGPTHNPAPELTVQRDVPGGTVYTFLMQSTDSKIYTGIARDTPPAGQAGRGAGGRGPISVHAAPYTRKVTVYVPKQYVAGTSAPFIVGADGPDPYLFPVLDNLIAQKRVPAMVAISIGNGGSDAQGSERGHEYDTMSGLYAEFVEKEVLPRVERECSVKLTKDPEANLLRHLRKSAVAGEPGDAARRLGVPRTPDPQQRGETDTPVDGSRRQG
jgi:hypothetical protein